MTCDDCEDLQERLAATEDHRDALLEENRRHRLSKHEGTSCAMLAARLVAVEKERDDIKALYAVAQQTIEKLHADALRASWERLLALETRATR